MPVNSVPAFSLPENSAPHVLISTANANRDGTGTMGTVLTAGEDGAIIDLIIIKATGVTTAGMVRLFIHDGTNARLLDEVDVTAVAAPGATTKTFRSEYVPTRSIRLPPTWSLRASTHNAEEFVVRALGGNF